MIKYQKISDWIHLYRFGNPFKTQATTLEINDKGFEECQKIPAFHTRQEDKTVQFRMQLNPDDIVYGLGENLGGLNKRGKRYCLFSTDDPSHTPEKESLYGSNPMLIIDGDQKIGLFIDYPSKMIFDIGFTHKDELSITIENDQFDLYLIEANDKKTILNEYLTLVGAPFVPPKWAFGFQQSRWSYPDEATVEQLVDQFRSRGIPCDAVYLDIDSMVDYKVFTVDQSKFPQFDQFIKKMKQRGIKIVPIIDPGVKVEKGYSVYEEGVEKGFFCFDHDVNAFIGSAWPGLVHYPDFLNENACKWWGDLYHDFLDLGIEGFWNDMNEPAIFFTPQSLAAAQVKINETKKINNSWDFFEIKDLLPRLANRDEDYQALYHKIDGKNLVNHYDVHNLYGYLMAVATVEGFKRKDPDKRYFLLSRSNTTGLHRIAAIWQGDNQSWWEHLLLSIHLLINLNMCGFFYTGPDTGGFSGNSSPELAIRWMQLGVFTPLYRNHSAIGTRHQEPFAFDEQTTSIIKRAVQLRYALLPYLYSQFIFAVKKNTPFISALAFSFDDQHAKQVEDQFMFGPSIMAAPIYRSNARGRYVYLPQCQWLYWQVKDYEQREIKVYARGHHYIDCALDEIPLFIKENSLISLTEAQNYVHEKEIEELTIIGFVTERAVLTYYDDDGNSMAYERDQFTTIDIVVEKKGGQLDYSFQVKESEQVKNSIKKLNFEIYDEQGQQVKHSLMI